jgi:hypothetical protein
MPRPIGKFIFITIIFCVTLTSTACGSLGASDEDVTSATAIAIEAQTVPEATPTPKPTLAPKPTATDTPIPPSTDLPTEIIEPISPISPVATGEGVAVSLPGDSVQPIPGSEESLAAAIADLSKQTGILPGEVVLVSIEAVDWSDTSLGCPQEGFMYAQVITAGYIIVLEARGQQYQYHTDQAANVVLCQE